MNIVAGWYGKLPALGDFATRRLPPAFVESWDGWLANGLADWRADGDEWLESYLNGPLQRFVVGPGVLAPAKVAQAWAGVLMPSVDRVGRYFPLTIAAALAPQAAAGHAGMLLHWLQHVGDLAADALHEEWGAEQVDAALAQLAEATVTAGADGALHDELTRLVAASAGATGHVLWWHVLDDGSIELQRSHGLPRGAAFARLLSGLPLNGAPNGQSETEELP